MAPFISDRRLWLTADKESVVEDGDPDARFLLCGEGGTVPAEEAERLGLKQANKPEDKQRKKTEDKSAKSAKKKK